VAPQLHGFFSCGGVAADAVFSCFLFQNKKEKIE
jgi:hypothetical protein